MTQSDYCSVFKEDVLEICLQCHAALAQDSPEPPTYYINQILNLAFGRVLTKFLSRVQGGQLS